MSICYAPSQQFPPEATHRFMAALRTSKHPLQSHCNTDSCCSLHRTRHVSVAVLLFHNTSDVFSLFTFCHVAWSRQVGGKNKEMSTRHYVNLTESGLTGDCKKIQQRVVVLLWWSIINIRSYAAVSLFTSSTSYVIGRAIAYLKEFVCYYWGKVLSDFELALSRSQVTRATT